LVCVGVSVLNDDANSAGRRGAVLSEQLGLRSSAHDFAIVCRGGSRLQPTRVAASAIMTGVFKQSPSWMNVRRHS
jgi:hypothetical protein